ncbi:MAG TPA: patatin-like phospholipase family protein [Aliidongia sp.]|nr:patatin-like phospholipase family protein [Aliidongia sp.]
MTPTAQPPRPASYDKKVALVLQGGGALGSYQAGVYEALAGSDYPPDWVAGISIGAINAALIAGNAPKDRVDRLRAFWDEITSAPIWPGLPAHLVQGAPSLSAAHAVLFGQPGFFAPRPPMSWLMKAQPLSFYDTTALKGTLERLVDFDRINAREIRFSVGAVNVQTGNFAYFDNAEITIRPEHVMASGALPPGFPPVEIDGEFYWDGGLVSNTPLQYVIDTMPRRSRLTFQVDLFSARGPLPTDLDTVGEREKDIRYSSRTRAGTETCRRIHDVRHIINDLLERQPDLRDSPEGRILYEFSCVTTMDIVELIYRPTEDQGVAKDFEFGHGTMRARWAQGLSDAKATLRASPWLAPMPPEVGVRTFDVLGGSAKATLPY